MQVGDKVEVIDDAISGIIISIKLNAVVILTTDDFEMQYAKNELVVINDVFTKKDFLVQNISEIISEKETKRKKSTKLVKTKDRSLPPMEVDLHIHQLVNSERGLNSYDKLTLQMETAKRQLEFAISKRIPKVVFIHGIGEGVLKEELYFLFNRYDNVKFYDADYQKYGRGATEVYIFQSKPAN